MVGRSTVSWRNLSFKVTRIVVLCIVLLIVNQYIVYFKVVNCLDMRYLVTLIMTIPLLVGSLCASNCDSTLVILGDLEICYGESTVLTTEKVWSEYIWSTGENSPTSEANVSGTYCLTVTDDMGCTTDTCVDVVVSSPATTSISLSMCPGDWIFINGVTYYWPGSFVDTIYGGAANGCDSILDITIVEIPLFKLAFDVTICEGDSVLIHDIYYSFSGIYIDTIYGLPPGCDTIVQVICTVNPGINLQAYEIMPDDGSGSGSITLPTDPGLTYLWSNGQTGPEANMLLSGFYSVTVTDADGCQAEATYYVPLEIPIKPGVGPPAKLAAHPNPTNGNLGDRNTRGCS